MVRGPPRSKRTDTIFPYTNIFRSPSGQAQGQAVLPLEVEVRRDRPGGRGPAEGAGGREPAPKESAGGVDARQRGAEGSAGKKLRRPAARREAALRLMAEHGFSQRRACRLIEVNPKTVRRQVTADAPEVRRRLRELAGERSRFGYCRLGVLLAREGMGMNHTKLLRSSEEHTSQP